MRKINAILSTAFIKENPEVDGVWGAPPDLVFDVVTQGEGKDMASYFEDVGKAFAKVFSDMVGLNWYA